MEGYDQLTTPQGESFHYQNRRSYLGSVFVGGLIGVSGCLRMATGGQNEADGTGDSESTGDCRLLLTFDWSEVRRPESHPDDGRLIAFSLYEIQVLGNDGSLLETYDIGNPSEEPQLVEGYFKPESSQTGTFRHFGGPTETSRLVIGPFSNPESISLISIRGDAMFEALTVDLSIGGADAGSFDPGTTVTSFHVDMPAEAECGL